MGTRRRRCGARRGGCRHRPRAWRRRRRNPSGGQLVAGAVVVVRVDDSGGQPMRSAPDTVSWCRSTLGSRLPRHRHPSPNRPSWRRCWWGPWGIVGRRQRRRLQQLAYRPMGQSRTACDARRCTRRRRSHAAKPRPDRSPWGLVCVFGHPRPRARRGALRLVERPAAGWSQAPPRTNLSHIQPAASQQV